MAQGEPQAAADGRKRWNVLRLLEERTLAAQNELAGRSDAGADVLGYLAREGAPATRRAVAANAAAPPEANRHLADDEDEDVRAELARKIARLMPSLSKRESEKLKALTTETLERLAADQVPRVRAILAEEIKHLDCVPGHVVQALARDVEALVCVPILEYSPLLSDADLIEIIAEGKIHAVLAAVARRRPVSAPVCDAVVSSLDVSAVAALLTNPDATIREQTLDDIVEQAETISAWQEPLTLRADLSRRAVRRLASFVSSEMIEQLAARHYLDEQTKLHLNRQVRLRLESEQEGPTAIYSAATKEVALAERSGKLNDSFVEAAAEAGKREAVLLALARLTRLPEELVRRILLTRSAKPVIALVWHAGLGMRAAFKIQRFVMKLSAEELLPARDGVRFPMNEEEMRWHLGYFGIAA
jgi:uncharacterized protein (DUF2336 family)